MKENIENSKEELKTKYITRQQSMMEKGYAISR